MSNPKEPSNIEVTAPKPGPPLISAVHIMAFTMPTVCMYDYERRQ
jgi:hypothetical protein